MAGPIYRRFARNLVTLLGAAALALGTAACGSDTPEGQTNSVDTHSAGVTQAALYLDNLSSMALTGYFKTAQGDSRQAFDPVSPGRTGMILVADAPDGAPRPSQIIKELIITNSRDGATVLRQSPITDEAWQLEQTDEGGPELRYLLPVHDQDLPR